MNDNKNFQINRDADTTQIEIYSKMSFIQKLRQAAWVMKVTGVRALHPNWSEIQIQDSKETNN